MVQSQAISVTVAGLARAAEVGVETIRYYQRRGLLSIPVRAVAKQGNGVRRYGEQHLHRLKFIRKAQSAGFTLEQIGELLSLDATEDRARARALAKARIGELDARVTELQTARDALSRLARQCANSMGPCPILRAFD